MASGKVQWIAGSLAAAMAASTLAGSVALAGPATGGPTTRRADGELRKLGGAAPTSRAEGEPGRVGSGGGGRLKGWAQTVLALALVIGLILLLRLVLRKVRWGGRLFAGGGAVEVLAATSLSAKERLVLVRLGRRVLLLGSAPGGLTTLSEITDPGEAGELVERFSAARRKGGPGGAGGVDAKSPPAAVGRGVQDGEGGQ